MRELNRESKTVFNALSERRENGHLMEEGALAGQRARGAREASFYETGRTASVILNDVAVITFFSRIEELIATVGADYVRREIEAVARDSVVEESTGTEALGRMEGERRQTGSAN